MSTNVLWAGNVSGNAVVSIFNNPTGQEGSNLPLTSPYDYLDRIYLDTRFSYLNTIWQTTFTQNFASIQATESDNFGDAFTTVAFHNLGYTPVAILIDSDTRESINSGNFIQVVDSVSYRNISLLMDSTKFYIKEKYYTKDSNLPAITRRFTILAFSNSAEVPAI